MPTPMDAMLGLVVTAIGLMTVVIAFLIADGKKRNIAYMLAGVVTAVGLYYYVASEMRGIQMRRRLSTLQQQQQVNLEEIQKRLRSSQLPEKPGAPTPPGR